MDVACNVRHVFSFRIFLMQCETRLQLAKSFSKLIEQSACSALASLGQLSFGLFQSHFQIFFGRAHHVPGLLASLQNLVQVSLICDGVLVAIFGTFLVFLRFPCPLESFPKLLSQGGNPVQRLHKLFQVLLYRV